MLERGLPDGVALVDGLKATNHVKCKTLLVNLIEEFLFKVFIRQRVCVQYCDVFWKYLIELLGNDTTNTLIRDAPYRTPLV